MSESYLTSVTPDIRKAYEYQERAAEAAQLFGGIVVRHAFIGGESSEHQLILPHIVWGDEPDMRGYFSLMDYDGELLFGDQTGAGAKELAEQVRSAELELIEGYSGPILTVDIVKGGLTDYAHRDLTLDQLNSTIADLRRYEQTIIDGTAPLY